MLAVNGYEAVKSRYQACLYDGAMCANEMEAYVTWTGDIAVYQQAGKITTAIPPAVVSRLIDFDKRFTGIVELSATQKVKVALKLACLKLKRQGGKIGRVKYECVRPALFNNADAVRLRYFNAPRSQRCGRLA